MVSSAIISGIFREDFLRLRRFFALGEVACPTFLLEEAGLRPVAGFALTGAAFFDEEAGFPERAFAEPFAEALDAVFFSETINTQPL